MSDAGKREAATGRKALRIAGRAVACATSGATLAACGFSWYTYHDLTAGLTTSNAIQVVQQAAKAQGVAAPPPHLDKSVNILLIGLDSRKDQDGNDLPKQFVQDDLMAGSSDIGGYNTNTLILMHIPAGGGRVEAFSIPRDDYVDLVNVPGAHPLGKGKIKEAYDQAKYYAEEQLSQQYSGADLEHRGRDAGRAATLLTVQKFLNVPIDHFAELNLKGFYDVAQALGPITVCLKKDISDPIISRTATTAGGGSGFVGHAGLNQLDPTMALAFVRQRHNLPDGDFDRTHRQQAFIASVTTKLKQEGVFGDLGRMQGLLNAVKQDVVLDNTWDLLDFAQQATNLTGGNTEFNTLPMERYATLSDGEDVNIVDVAKVQAMVRQAITGVDTAPPSAAPSDSATPSPSGSSSPSTGPTPGSPTPAAPTSPAAGTDDSGDGGDASQPSPTDSYAGPAVDGGVPCVN
ncbi:LCP family protein [Kitasatospora sp. NBC_01250]|uniref:LCP family protein n=1 Tax=Kitasatospora sp. NBC_01250 TaxID=2903571 RepID=UPI002E2FA530|nr:LCP family protein [Kitasatospora sp. NBC_01250]